MRIASQVTWHITHKGLCRRCSLELVQCQCHSSQSRTKPYQGSYGLTWCKASSAPTDKHNLKTWRCCEYEDHIYDQSRQNAITPMSHIFLKTEETSRESRLSRLQYQNKQEGGDCSSIITSRKRNGLPFNQWAPVLNDTATSYFRDSSMGKLKQNFVFVVDNGVNMPGSSLVGMLFVRLQRHLGIKKGDTGIICRIPYQAKVCWTCTHFRGERSC